MKWKHSLNFGCFSIYLSLHLILLPFLSQMEFFFIHSFPFLSPELLLSFHPTFILVLFNFCFLDKTLNNLSFFFGFFFLCPPSCSHLCHKAFTFLVFYWRQTDCAMNYLSELPCIILFAVLPKRGGCHRISSFFNLLLSSFLHLKFLLTIWKLNSCKYSYFYFKSYIQWRHFVGPRN